MGATVAVKEPQYPVNGEFTLDDLGNLVIFVNGSWTHVG
jgi:hypothetical protein